MLQCFLYSFSVIVSAISFGITFSVIVKHKTIPVECLKIQSNSAKFVASVVADLFLPDPYSLPQVQDRQTVKHS